MQETEAKFTAPKHTRNGLCSLSPNKSARAQMAPGTTRTVWITRRKKTISNAGIDVLESFTKSDAIANRTPDAVVSIRPRPDLQQGRRREDEGCRRFHKGSLSARRFLQQWLTISLGDVKLRKLSLSLSNKTCSSVSSSILPRRHTLLGGASSSF